MKKEIYDIISKHLLLVDCYIELLFKYRNQYVYIEDIEVYESVIKRLKFEYHRNNIDFKSNEQLILIKDQNKSSMLNSYNIKNWFDSYKKDDVELCLRVTGKSNREVNKLIQKLFNDGFVQVTDHSQIIKIVKYNFNKILNRLREYNIINTSSIDDCYIELK